ncbi:hypothetical protein [Caballeronia grimmiae]|uniref:hypothetical protein n=1 Tax=Caballeronia grimmiae TaxID=1071679 RepID=UPI0038BD38E2
MTSLIESLNHEVKTREEFDAMVVTLQELSSAAYWAHLKLGTIPSCDTRDEAIRALHYFEWELGAAIRQFWEMQLKRDAQGASL